jgi:ribosomal protein L16/L10AE
MVIAMFKLNAGFGCGKIRYTTLKGARIAANKFLKQSGLNWISIVEFKNGTPYQTHYYPSLGKR